MSRPVLASIAVALVAGLASVAIAGAPVDKTAGKNTYEAQCLICHGQAGDGAGPAGAALRPAPTDFTAAAYWLGKTDAAIMAKIRQGNPGTSMQAYNKMSREDMQNLMAYLRSFEPAK
jgi:high-affinity iron transporter